MFYNESDLLIFTMNCKSILTMWLRTLILEEYPEANLDFLQASGIQLFQFGVPGNKVGHPQSPCFIILQSKEPFVDIPEATIQDALSVIMGKSKIQIFGLISYHFFCLYSCRSTQSSHSHPLQQGKGKSLS